MRSKIGFALLFVCTLWLSLHLLGQTQARRAALPPMQRVSAQVTLLPMPREPEAPRPTARIAGKAAAAQSPAASAHPPVAAPVLTAPYYRAAWQAFPLEGSAG